MLKSLKINFVNIFFIKRVTFLEIMELIDINSILRICLFNLLAMKKLFTILIFLAFVFISENSFSQIEYKGTVRYNNNEGTPVKSVTVQLHDNFGNIVSTALTNSQGKYHLKNIASGTYTLNFSGYCETVSFDINNANKILMHLLGISKLNKLQLLTADIDGNGKVNWNDLTALITDFFVYGQKHEIGKYVSIPKQIKIGENSLKDGEDGDGTVGAVGDPDGSFKPTTKTGKDPINLKYANSVKIAPNQFVEVPVYLKNQPSIGGFAISMNYDAGAMNFEQISSQIEGLNYNGSDGLIKLSWQNTNIGSDKVNLTEPLFVLKFRTSSMDEIKELNNITINKESQIIDVNGILLQNAQMSIPSFIGSEGVNELNDIYPNPIYNTATINYSLSAPYKVTLSVYNTVGQLVTNLVDEEQNAGDHEIVFNRTYLNLSAGSYIYRLECKGEQSFVQSKIMIIR